jgi:hypothetical protein
MEMLSDILVSSIITEVYRPISVSNFNYIYTNPEALLVNAIRRKDDCIHILYSALPEYECFQVLHDALTEVTRFFLQSVSIQNARISC